MPNMTVSPAPGPPALVNATGFPTPLPQASSPLEPSATASPELSACDAVCAIGGSGRHSCRARVLWVSKHPRTIPSGVALALVNEECGGQCHCEASDMGWVQ